jgi:hypothetical protein
MVRGSILVLVSAFLSACAAGDGPGNSAGKERVASEACDPLAPGPTTLGTVVGVGADAAGVLYVSAANGVFVSQGDELIRQHVTGEGSSGTSEYLFTFAPPDADVAAAQNLLVETQAGVASAMALGPSDSKAFLDQPGTARTPLTVVDANELSVMPIVNTPNEISYLADAANGSIVLATVPMNRDPSSTDGGLSIFYGPPDNVAERLITDFEQSLSNEGTVTFLVGSTSYVLAFGMVPDPDAGPFGTFTLKGLTPQGGDTIAVTLRAPTPAALPAELAFTCLR